MGTTASTVKDGSKKDQLDWKHSNTGGSANKQMKSYNSSFKIHGNNDG